MALMDTLATSGSLILARPGLSGLVWFSWSDNLWFGLNWAASSVSFVFLCLVCCGLSDLVLSSPVANSGQVKSGFRSPIQWPQV